MTPFAAFDGKRWDAPWPSDLLGIPEVPVSLDQVPRRWWGKAGAPVGMSVWADGSRRGSLSLERPTTLRVMCDARLALASDYQSREAAPPATVQPYPKDGLAISGTQPIEAIEIVPRTAPEWNSIAMKLIELADRAETGAIDLLPKWKHPFARRERQKTPVEIEMLYRAPMDAAGWTAYYVEAIKRYPPGPEDDGCGLVTSVKGWITSGPDFKSQDSIYRTHHVLRSQGRHVHAAARADHDAREDLLDLSGFRLRPGGLRGDPSDAEIHRAADSLRRGDLRPALIYFTVTFAQSHPSSPLAFTAFTATTVPGWTAVSVAGGFMTRICCASGFDAGP